MNDKAGVATVAEDEESGELRSKLLGRLAVAGGLVALLLGVLVLFDYLSGSDEPEATVYTQPVPVAPKKQVSQPVTPTDQLPEPPVAEKPVAVAEAAEKPVPMPESKQMPADERRAQAENGRQPKEVGGTVSHIEKPATSASVVTARGHQSPVPEATQAPANLTTEPAPVVRIESARPEQARPQRVAEVEASRLQPVTASTPSARLLSGFLLQAGIFTSMQRAEELHARLLQNGVPSTLETRVQVGPFRTRQEAEAAQSKLRELGVTATLLSPPAPRH